VSFLLALEDTGAAVWNGSRSARKQYGPGLFGGLEASAGAGRLIRAELLLEAVSLIDQ